MKSLLLAMPIVATSFLFISCSSNHHKKVQDGALRIFQAEMKSPKSKNFSGTVTFEEKKEGIFMTAHVTGAKPDSSFGFHIHEKGKCEGPDFKSAGDHLNPYDHPHSGPEKEKRHLGDLGNLSSDNKGHAMKEFFISPNASDMDLILGKAIILHAETDDLVTQPSGNSGERIACGLIEIHD